MRTTHTFALLDVSPATYNEVKAKLEAAGYGHALIQTGEGELVIEMHGLALREEPAPTAALVAPSTPPFVPLAPPGLRRTLPAKEGPPPTDEPSVPGPGLPPGEFVPPPGAPELL